MPAPLISKEEVLRRLTLSFRARGYHGTSLKDLCEATGLPKASLYNYFSGGKEAMAQAVLDHVAGWFATHVVLPLERDGDPRARLQHMVTELTRFYDKGRRACLIDLFGVGLETYSFGPSLSSAVEGWQAAIAHVLRDAGWSETIATERAELALVRIQGSLVLARAKGEPRLFVRHLGRLPDDLLAPD